MKSSKYEKIASSGKDSKVKLNKDSLRNIIRFALPYWPWFALAFILIICISVADILQPLIIKYAIDDNISPYVDGILSADKAIRNLGILALMYVGLSFIHFLFGFIQEYTLQKTGSKIITELRKKMFSHVQRLPFTYFDKTPVGTIVTRICNDTNAISEFYTGVLISFFKDIFVMIGILVTMFIMDVKLTLITITVLPLIAFASVTFRLKARQAFFNIRTKMAAINAFVAEHTAGMKIIQAFNMEKKKEEEFDQINNEYYKANMERIKIFGIFRPFMDVVKSFSLAIVIYVGAKEVAGASIEVGILYLFIRYIGNFFQPIMNLTEMFNTTQSAVVAADRITTVFETKPESEEVQREPILTPEKCKGRIEFDHVWFAYIDDLWVLKDVSFTVEPGESVAIVGMTGAGKTSIISLLCGFYEIQKGSIRIDGVDIKDMTKQELRRLVGMVRQDVFMFSGSILHNITLGNEDITFDRVQEAAVLTNAHEFIKDLPGQYDFQLNEGGSILSEGQRQLISFARAIVTDPKILVLDEATSNIDSETERLIQDALVKLMRNRSSISIAHRLSTIQNSDKIIVLNNGRIMEQGTHDELFEMRGLYYDLYNLQFE
ncbi:MAG: ABC transporter ATP-binding protein [Clostridiaceae bacterium]|nr:ABC transporter ATP-binding protein [Clostridiaceae bacterium]